MVKIRYLFHDTSNASYYSGSGEMVSFGTGMSDISYFGTFTNTSKTTMVYPPLVVAAATTKKASSISAMDARIKNKKIPTGIFYFFPSSAYTVGTSQDDYDAFWASLPFLVL